MDESTKNGVYHSKYAVSREVNDKYVLCLYIAGTTPQSRRAVQNVQKICQESLADICDLQIIDIFQQPYLAKADQIIAVPTLVKRLPSPKRLFIGDMSDTNTILANLVS